MSSFFLGSLFATLVIGVVIVNNEYRKYLRDKKSFEKQHLGIEYIKYHEWLDNTREA